MNLADGNIWLSPEENLEPCEVIFHVLVSVPPWCLVMFSVKRRKSNANVDYVNLRVEDIL